MNQRIQPFFRRAPAPLAFLAFYIALSVLMLLSDLHWHTMDFLRSSLSAVIQPIQVVTQAPVRWASELSSYLTEINQLREDNENYQRYYLRSAAALVRMDELEKENDRLRRLLDLKTRDRVTGHVARILSTARDPLVRRIIVDKGSQQDIRDGMPVINTEGLIGQVTRTNVLVSEITLITDKNQVVPVKISRNGLRTLLYGLGNGMMELKFLPSNTDIQVDDILVTSGLDGVYLPGLPVGRVIQLNRDPSFAFARILCAPLSAIENHDEVLILQTQGREKLVTDESQAQPAAASATEPENERASSSRKAQSPASKTNADDKKRSVISPGRTK